MPPIRAKLIFRTVLFFLGILQPVLTAGDCDIVLAAYNAMSGNPLLAPDASTDSSCCGSNTNDPVTCDVNNKVTGISWPGSTYFSDPFTVTESSSLWQLSALRLLALTGAPITSFAAASGNSLTDLYLQECLQLTSFQGFDTLSSSLSTLHLDNDVGLSGTFPPSSVDFSSLVDCQVAGTSFCNNDPGLIPSACSSSNLPTCFSSDCSAAFEYFTNGFLGSDSGWIDASQNCCDGSFGITCDANSRITEINWSSRSLTGAFPNDIFTLSYLRTLNIDTNAVTGDVNPTAVNSVVRNLLLNHNQLSFIEPAKFSNLFALAIGDNLLTGPEFQSGGTGLWGSLGLLDISASPFSYISSNVELSSLQLLDIHETQFTSLDPYLFVSNSLNDVNARGSALTGTLNPLIFSVWASRGYPSGVSFDVRSTNLKGQFPPSGFNLPNTFFDNGCYLSETQLCNNDRSAVPSSCGQIPFCSTPIITTDPSLLTIIACEPFSIQVRVEDQDGNLVPGMSVYLDAFSACDALFSDANFQNSNLPGTTPEIGPLNITDNIYTVPGNEFYLRAVLINPSPNNPTSSCVGPFSSRAPNFDTLSWNPSGSFFGVSGSNVFVPDVVATGGSGFPISGVLIQVSMYTSFDCAPSSIDSYFAAGPSIETDSSGVGYFSSVKYNGIFYESSITNYVQAYSVNNPSIVTACEPIIINPVTPYDASSLSFTTFPYYLIAGSSFDIVVQVFYLVEGDSPLANAPVSLSFYFDSIFAAGCGSTPVNNLVSGSLTATSDSFGYARFSSLTLYQLPTNGRYLSVQATSRGTNINGTNPATVCDRISSVYPGNSRILNLTVQFNPNTAGSSFGNSGSLAPTISLGDQYANPISGDSISLTVYNDDRCVSDGQLSAALYSVSPVTSNPFGYAIFSDLNITAVGNWGLKANGSESSSTCVPLSIIANTAGESRLLLSFNPGSSGVFAGRPLGSSAPSVGFTDSSGNPLSGGTVSLGVFADDALNSPLTSGYSSPDVTTDSSGSAVFSDLNITTAGSWYLAASYSPPTSPLKRRSFGLFKRAPGGSTIFSNVIPISVAPGSAYSVSLTQVPASYSPSVAFSLDGSPFSTVLDSYQNPISGSSVSLNAYSDASCSVVANPLVGTPLIATQETNSSGVASFGSSSFNVNTTSSIYLLAISQEVSSSCIGPMLSNYVLPETSSTVISPPSTAISTTSSAPPPPLTTSTSSSVVPPPTPVTSVTSSSVIPAPSSLSSSDPGIPSSTISASPLTSVITTSVAPVTSSEVATTSDDPIVTFSAAPIVTFPAAPIVTSPAAPIVTSSAAPVVTSSAALVVTSSAAPIVTSSAALAVISSAALAVISSVAQVISSSAPVASSAAPVQSSAPPPLAVASATDVEQRAASTSPTAVSDSNPNQQDPQGVLQQNGATASNDSSKSNDSTGYTPTTAYVVAAVAVLGVVVAGGAAVAPTVSYMALNIFGFQSSGVNFTGTSPASDIMRFAGGTTAGSTPTIVVVDGGQAANSLMNTGIAGAGAINLTVGLGTSNSGNMGSDANMYGRINEAISNGALVRDPSS